MYDYRPKLHRLSEALRQAGGRGHSGELVVAAVRDHHRKFITAKSRHELADSHGAAQPLRKFAQHLIAGHVSVDVVDRLEAVEVQEQKRHVRTTAFGAGDGACQFCRQRAPVREAGQGVLTSQSGCARFGGNAYRDLVRQFHPAPQREDAKRGRNDRARQDEGIALGVGLMLKIGESPGAHLEV